MNSVKMDHLTRLHSAKNSYNYNENIKSYCSITAFIVSTIGTTGNAFNTAISDAATKHSDNQRGFKTCQRREK